MHPEILDRIVADEPTKPLLRLMNLDDPTGLAWRVDLVSEMVKARAEIDDEIRDAKMMLDYWRKRHEAVSEVLLQAVKRGGKITSTNPSLDGFTTCYLKTTEAVVVAGFCKAHSDLHLLGPDCIDFTEAPERLPEPYQRVKVEAKRREIAEVLKKADPMNPPAFAKLEPHESVVVLRPKPEPEPEPETAA